jgi:tRNA uridine 5-carboxymethylaminomethyl modification enzyme
MLFEEYDIIVVGGGHAGCEAAAVAANKGSRVLLVSMNLQTIAQMSCNPAMGGIAKGQMIREIDALGGYSGIVSDRSMIQFRMLNRSKGPAMWSPRSQNDRMLFAIEWRNILESIDNIDFWQDMVIGLHIKNNSVCGVKTQMGHTIKAKAVILTNGTFLNGLIHIGEKSFGGGRSGEKASYGITEQLKTLGFKSGRLKTGTPPRVDGRSLDYTKMEEQKGDENPGKFSFSNETKALERQRSCHITYTSPIVHEILRKGFRSSPMFSGRIEGTGPRYCPSIEDKIERFSERERHQIFVEPEGWNTVEVYVNGYSTSLAEDVQIDGLRNIRGFENVKMFRPGYAIEYDYFNPNQLKNTLETKHLNNLYLAGQINGTTGYEEAACQGLWAGINAHSKLNDEGAFVLKRSEAYIGVLIDDLINKGTDEPYRMFTSRAEFRLLLRQDNADQRLSPIAYRHGLISEERIKQTELKRNKISGIVDYFKKTSIEPRYINPILEKLNTNTINQKKKLFSFIGRPQVKLNDLLPLIELSNNIFNDSIANNSAEIEMKYEGYIKKEEEFAKKFNKFDDINIPDTINYKMINSLSSEAKEKLSNIKPHNLGQASRISGISPSDLSVLMLFINN